MLDQNCAYCMKGDLVAKFGYFCCEMESSNVYIFKELTRLIMEHMVILVIIFISI